MKYFHISAEFDLLDKPAWLDEFRRRYDVAYAYHVTLKNPTEIKDDDVAQMKQDLETIIGQAGIEEEPVEVVFDQLKFNCTSSSWCIMVMSEGNERLTKLQLVIRETLSKYGANSKPEYESFEKNFDPHLTIGRHLNEKRFEQAKRSLDGPIELKGVLERITLTVVDEQGDDNWTNNDNKAFYRLSAK